MKNRPNPNPFINSVLKATRASQEGFIRNRGWCRLVTRADVWVYTLAIGSDLHSVYLFQFALEVEIKAAWKRRKQQEKTAPAGPGNPINRKEVHHGEEVHQERRQRYERRQVLT